MNGVAGVLTTRATKRCLRKVLEGVIVRTIPGNIQCISVETFVNIPLIKMPQRQFLGHILN